MGHAANALTRLPLLGSIDGSTRAHPPRIRHPTFGRSSSRVATVIRFVVDDNRRLPAGVGQLVKRQLFRDVPPFTCNIAFACGPIRRNRGSYSDPSSPWFNVFTGVYEVVVKRSLWPEPFAYRDGKPMPEQLLRLGVADWWYFSAYLYGVPLGTDMCGDPLAGAQWTSAPHCGPEGLARWDRVDACGIRVPAPSAALRWWERGQPSPVWRALWQLTLGCPPQRAASPRHCLMRARTLLRTYSDDRHHRTLVLGATANMSHPNVAATTSLLEAQFRSIEDLAMTRYRRYGGRFDA
jgi:hypothetical protein